MRTDEIEEWAPDSMTHDQQLADQDNAGKSRDARSRLCCNKGSAQDEMDRDLMTTASSIASGCRLLFSAHEN